MVRFPVRRVAAFTVVTTRRQRVKADWRFSEPLSAVEIAAAIRKIAATRPSASTMSTPPRRRRTKDEEPEGFERAKVRYDLEEQEKDGDGFSWARRGAGLAGASPRVSTANRCDDGTRDGDVEHVVWVEQMRRPLAQQGVTKERPEARNELDQFDEAKPRREDDCREGAHSG